MSLEETIRAVVYITSVVFVLLAIWLNKEPEPPQSKPFIEQLTYPQDGTKIINNDTATRTKL